MKKADDLVVHMRRVQAAERDLRDLGVVWQMIESSAAISCPDAVENILPTLVRTRERFDDLQGRLIDRMIEENHAELADDLTAKAQCAIDILVRNLYERTADVGFLATDDVVRDFCSADAGSRAALRTAMVQRLRDYRAKYTVYDDVILLAPSGEVLARLDEQAGLTRCTDALLARALERDGHVEQFRLSDLGGDTPALLYAHRISDARGHPVGVLVLRFRFADEMGRIFRDVDDGRHHLALVLIGDDHRVIVSNDEAHVPVGALMRPVPDDRITLTAFAGREYMTVACPSHGYQGYRGPGWRAQAMVSLLTAFRQHHDDSEVIDNVPLDNPELDTICRDADAINRDLRRVVWNGRLDSGDHVRAGDPRADATRLKAVLSQVSVAGQRTRERVDRATKDLYRTSLSRSRLQSVDLARMAADVMDRNLYERANDCRWWALSPAIQRALAGEPGSACTQALAPVLDHINGLYTVYSRLVVFDAHGVIRGCSRADEASGLVGSPVDPEWLQAVRGLGDPQQYAVSRFEDTALHTQGPTYAYLAAVRSGEPGREALGGIAIVFNARRELHAMLGEIIADRQGFAAFVDDSGLVLASSHPELCTDRTLGFAGERAIVEHGGVHYTCARVRAGGYREFKTTDGHKNQVSAVVGLRLGNTERRHSAMSDLTLRMAPVTRREQSMDVAIFQVGPARYALPAAAVMEAISPRGLVRTPGTHPCAVGLLEVSRHQQPQLVQVQCARRHFGVDYPARATDGVVLVLRSPQAPEQPVLGLRVDDVLAVMSVDRHRLHVAPEGVSSFAPWIGGLLDAQVIDGTRHADVLIQLLDPQAMVAEVTGSTMPAMALA